MKAEEFKAEVQKILGLTLRFDGHVDSVIESIPERRQNTILVWISDCAKGNVIPEPCKNFKNIISLIYKTNDNRIRGILTKEKNSYFIELFLDKHKYYDRKRRYLGL